MKKPGPPSTATPRGHSRNPTSGRIAVKVINHLGDEVMKVFRVRLMEFRIADTFTDSLARLTGDEQKAVKTTAFDLQVNPANPGHAIPQARQGQGPQLLVGSRQQRHAVDRPQDRVPASCCATSTTTTKPTSGRNGASWKRTRRPAPRSSSRFGRRSRKSRPRYVEVEQPAPPKPRLFADVPDDRLLSYGVPAEWLDDVRGATEDTVWNWRAICPPRPRRRCSISPPATRRRSLSRSRPGRSLRTSRCAAPVPRDEQRRRTGARPRISVGEVDRFPAPGPAQLVERDYSGPARVSGRPALARPSLRCIGRYSLSAPTPTPGCCSRRSPTPWRIRCGDKLRRLIGNEPRLGERLEVHSMNAIGRRLYELNFGRRRSHPARPSRELLDAAAGAVEGQQVLPAFPDDRVGAGGGRLAVGTWEAYRDVARLGRKTRLKEKQRAVLWRF